MTTTKTADAIDHLQFNLAEFPQHIEWAASSDKTCKKCGGLCTRFNYWNSPCDGRQCGNCGDVRPVFTRLNKYERELNALMAVHAAEMSNE